MSLELLNTLITEAISEEWDLTSLDMDNVEKSEGQVSPLIFDIYIYISIIIDGFIYKIIYLFYIYIYYIYNVWL